MCLWDLGVLVPLWQCHPDAYMHLVTGIIITAIKRPQRK